MIEHETDQMTTDTDAILGIPAPRSGKHWDMFVTEVLDGRHGCLDASVE